MTPLWLSHHWPDDYERCTLVGGRHVCRRCLWMYPLAFGVLVVGVLGVRLPPTVEIAGYAVATLPALVDFVLEHLGWSRPSPRRMVIVSVPLGVGLGLGFTRYVHAPGDPWFWAITVAYAGVAGAAWLTGRRWR
ncbi:hypothetical protein [Rhabdothermincola salaria]|uniref:hypothetical protein n=1 Tax=Rhabdothermincola salaria TaxID=2903142 RepID=UPI001E4BE23D|nr:hypothetical protein [Rhabdothermincola salaria]MCD9622984.1 hypothetical protein [Rhabdothermincola salaria]